MDNIAIPTNVAELIAYLSTLDPGMGVELATDSGHTVIDLWDDEL